MTTVNRAKMIKSVLNLTSPSERTLVVLTSIAGQLELKLATMVKACLKTCLKGFFFKNNLVVLSWKHCQLFKPEKDLQIIQTSLQLKFVPVKPWKQQQDVPAGIIACRHSNWFPDKTSIGLGSVKVFFLTLKSEPSDIIYQQICVFSANHPVKG